MQFATNNQSWLFQCNKSHILPSTFCWTSSLVKKISLESEWNGLSVVKCVFVNLHKVQCEKMKVRRSTTTVHMWRTTQHKCRTESVVIQQRLRCRKMLPRGTSRIFKYPDFISDQSHVSGKSFRTRSTLDRCFSLGSPTPLSFESAPPAFTARALSPSSTISGPRHVAIEKNYTI